MSGFVELAPHGPTGFIDLDRGLMSCLANLTRGCVGIVLPLRFRLAVAAGRQDNCNAQQHT